MLLYCNQACFGSFNAHYNSLNNFLKCFMEPLKNVQVEGHLMYAEPDEIFGNLDELCYVSFVI